VKIMPFLCIALMTPPLSLRASVPQAVTVRVRLVYARNGKPAKHQLVILDLGDPQHMSALEWKDQTRSPGRITGSDGVATFRVPKPFPSVVFVRYENGRVEGCARENLIPLQGVLLQGVTIGVDKEFGGACGADPTIVKRFAAKPGEIVILVRKLSWWGNP
jgi:hypothetical protein